MKSGPPEGVAWTKQAALLASDGSPTGRLGWSVNLSGRTLVIGSPGDKDKGPILEAPM